MKSKKLVSVLCATMSSLLLFGGNGSSLSAPGKFAVTILCAGSILGSKRLVGRAKARAKLGTCDTYTGETKNATCEQKNERESNFYCDNSYDDDDDDGDVNEPIYEVGGFWEILKDKKRLFGLLSDLKSTQARCYDGYRPIDSPLVVDSNYLRNCSEEVRKNYEGPYRFQYRSGDFTIVSGELYIYRGYSAFSDAACSRMTFSTYEIFCKLNTWSSEGRNNVVID